MFWIHIINHMGFSMVPCFCVALWEKKKSSERTGLQASGPSCNLSESLELYSRKEQDVNEVEKSYSDSYP